MKTADKGEAKLTSVACKTRPDGRWPEGAIPGLFLIVRGATRAWVLRYSSPVNGKRREMGLGSLAEVGLAEARSEALEARRKVRGGIDPIEAKQTALQKGKAAEVQKRAERKRDRATLRRVVRAYHEASVEPKRSDKHAAQWINSIEQHLPAKLLDRPIADIRAAELLDELRPIFQKVPETARRIKQRLEVVFDDALLRELVPGNPMRAIGRALRDEERPQGHFKSLAYADVPALVKRLQGLPGTAARALEFAILTAGRTGEVLGMPWSEVSEDGKEWRIPASRMKGREEHIVYLSEAAQAVLARVSGLSSKVVFPSPVDADQPMSNMAMLTLLKRLKMQGDTTVHGVCRSSFSTWANETAAARPDVIEATLAHKEADAVRRAYNRAQFMQERRELLAKWATFVAPAKKTKRTR